MILAYASTLFIHYVIALHTYTRSRCAHYHHQCCSVKDIHYRTNTTLYCVKYINIHTFPELTRRRGEVIVHAFNILTFVRRFSISDSFSFSTCCSILVHYVDVDGRTNESVYLIILVTVRAYVYVCVII